MQSITKERKESLLKDLEEDTIDNWDVLAYDATEYLKTLIKKDLKTSD